VYKAELRKGTKIMKDGEWRDGKYWAEVTRRIKAYYPKIWSIVFGGGEIESPFERFVTEREAVKLLDGYVFED
jgi:hypothetical protein